MGLIFGCAQPRSVPYHSPPPTGANHAYLASMLAGLATHGLCDNHQGDKPDDCCGHARSAWRDLHDSDPERTANGHDAWDRCPQQRIVGIADPMHERMLCDGIEYYPFKHRSDGSRERDLWWRDWPWRRCCKWCNEQIPGHRNCSHGTGPSMSEAA